MLNVYFFKCLSYLDHSLMSRLDPSNRDLRYSDEWCVESKSNTFWCLSILFIFSDGRTLILWFGVWKIMYSIWGVSWNRERENSVNKVRWIIIFIKNVFKRVYSNIVLRYKGLYFWHGPKKLESFRIMSEGIRNL